MLLYLDLNCFNRPFDDQEQARIVKETEAVFLILQRIENGKDQLLWSAVLAFENSRHPLKDRRDEISRWQQRAFATVGITTLLFSSRTFKMAETTTDAALRDRGLTALEQELGPVKAFRFLAMLSRQPFDYQDWRQKQFDGLSLRTILSQTNSNDTLP